MVSKYLSKYKGELLYSVSSSLTSGIAIISNLIATIFIAPAEIGAIQTVLLIQIYANFLHLGVFNGLNRNLAFYKAQENHSKVQLMVDTSFRVSLIVSALGVLLSLIVAVYVFINYDSEIYRWALILLLISLVVTPLSLHLDTTFRSGQEFGTLGIIKIKESVLYLLLSFSSAILGYFGKLLADSFRLIYGWILRIKKAPYRHKSKGNWEAFKELVAVGMPLLIGGYIWSVFVVADQTYIAASFDTHELGLYSLSRYCITAMMTLPLAINSLLYPKAATVYGKTLNKKDLLPFWKKSIFLYSLILVPLAVIGYFIIPVFVENLMPRYVGGIKSAQISLFTCLTFVSMGPSVIFGTLRRNGIQILIISICLISFWGIVTIFKDQFTTIESVAWLRFYISLGFMVVIILVTYLIIK